MGQKWSPSVVPSGVYDSVYLVVDCLDHLGCVWREADISGTDLETVIVDLLRGEYSDPLCVVAFNTSEGWARDVTADVAAEIKLRCDLGDNDVPDWLDDFVHGHVAPDAQLTLGLR